MSGAAGRIVKAGAQAVTKKVTPVSSRDNHEARLAVLKVYKDLQRLTPDFWNDYQLHDVPMPVFRDILKQQFVKNAHINDIRVIDRKVEECRLDMESINMRYYNTYHVRNYLFHENVDPKTKDFLSNFLAGNK